MEVLASRIGPPPKEHFSLRKNVNHVCVRGWGKEGSGWGIGWGSGFRLGVELRAPLSYWPHPALGKVFGFHALKRELALPCGF